MTVDKYYSCLSIIRGVLETQKCFKHKALGYKKGKSLALQVILAIPVVHPVIARPWILASLWCVLTRFSVNINPIHPLRNSLKKQGEGWGERQHCWMFARFWAWVELERERVGKKRKGSGAGCQVCGPLESAESRWGWRLEAEKYVHSINT